jgi:hypothetical protein
MHQTTLRFAPDLWEALSREAEEAGVSVAQYVREAALARLAYTAGRRGDALFEAALSLSGVRAPAPDPAPLQLAERAMRNAADETEGTAALWAQSRQARARAQELRESSPTPEAARLLREQRMRLP